MTTALAPTLAPTRLVFFSSVSENTSRFVDRLEPSSIGLDPVRIPLRSREGHLEVPGPYVLVVPTYGGGNERGAVPRQVAKFLNDPANRAGIRGVIASGNTNFGSAFCRAGPIISAKCGVPYLYGFELLGTAHDVERVRAGLARFREDLIAQSTNLQEIS